MHNILNLLGLAKKAGRLEIGEEPTGAAARARQARLILVARDAADNTFRRVRHFADAGNVPWVSVPATKEELGRAVGRASCAMLAVTDTGIAAAVVRGLAARNPEKYAVTAEKLAERWEKALQQQQEQRRHEKNLQKGRKKSAPPPRPQEKAAPGPKSADRTPPAPGKARPARPAGGARLRLSGSRPAGTGRSAPPSAGEHRRRRP